MRVKKPCLLLHQVTLAIFVGVWMRAPGNVSYVEHSLVGARPVNTLTNPTNAFLKILFL